MSSTLVMRCHIFAWRRGRQGLLGAVLRNHALTHTHAAKLKLSRASLISDVWQASKPDAGESKA